MPLPNSLPLTMEQIQQVKCNRGYEMSLPDQLQIPFWGTLSPSLALDMPLAMLRGKHTMKRSMGFASWKQKQIFLGLVTAK